MSNNTAETNTALAQRALLSEGVQTVLAVFIVGSAILWLIGWFGGLLFGGLLFGNTILLVITGEGLLSGLALFALLYGSLILCPRKSVRRAIALTSVLVSLMMLSGLWQTLLGALPAPWGKLDGAFSEITEQVYRAIGLFCLAISLLTLINDRWSDHRRLVAGLHLLIGTLSVTALVLLASGIRGSLAPQALGAQLIPLILISLGAAFSTLSGYSKQASLTVVLVAIGGLLAASTLWYMLLIHATGTANDRAENTAEEATVLLEQFLSQRLLALTRLAERNSQPTVRQGDNLWSLDSDTYFSDMSSLNGLALVDQQGRIQQRALRTGVGLDYARNFDQRLQTLEQPVSNQLVFRYSPTHGLMIIITPRHDDNGTRLVAGLNFATLLEDLYARLLDDPWREFLVTISHPEVELYDSNHKRPVHADHNLGHSRTLVFSGQPLTVYSAPSRVIRYQALAVSPNGLFVLVLSITLLLARGIQITTSRKELAGEAALLAQQMGFALDTLSDPVVLFDDNWQAQHINSAWRQRFPERTSSRSLNDLFPTLARRLPQDIADRCDDMPWQIELELPDKSWVDIRLFRYQDVTTLHLRDISALRKTEASLHSALRDLRRAQSITAIGSWEMELGPGIIHWSRQTARLMQAVGEQPDTISHQAYLALIHPDDAEEARRSHSRALHSGLRSDLTFRVSAPDGGTHWIRERTELLEEDNGEGKRRLVATLQDISEIKSTELLERKRRLILEKVLDDDEIEGTLSMTALLIEEQIAGSQCSIYELDKEASILNLRAAPTVTHTFFEKMKAVKVDKEIINGNIVIDNDIQKSPAWAAHHNMAREYGLRACWSFPLTGRDKRIIGSLYVYHPKPRNPSDREVDICQLASRLASIAFEHFHAHRDLNQAMLSIRSRNRQLRAVSEAAFEGYRLTDNQGLLANFFAQRLKLIVNAKLVIFHIGNASDFRRTGKVSALASDVARENEAILKKAIIETARMMEGQTGALRYDLVAGRSPYNHEIRRLLGHEGVSQEMMATALLGRDGLPIGFIAVAGKNNGEFSEQDEAILSQFAYLSALASESADLLTASRAALADLALANRELEEFTYVASHDLQEPLRKIRVFADRIMSNHADNLDQTGTDYLNRMAAAASRMQTLINDLLAYSRTGSAQPAMQSISLNEALEAALSNLEEQIRQSDAQINFADLPTVMGDRTMLTQALQNLLANAIKFSRPGVRPIIHITHKILTQDGTRKHHIEISDNGIGINARYLERVFSPFKRLHTRDEYPGSGIGLAIVRKVMHRHGGDVKVVSRPDEGSIFRLIFPDDPTIAEKTLPQKVVQS